MPPPNSLLIGSREQRPFQTDHTPAMTAPDLAYAAAVLTVAYFVRGISGFGSGLIAVPLLALRFPLTQVVPFMPPTST